MKKTLKKVLVAVLALAMLVSCLVGCGSEASSCSIMPMSMATLSRAISSMG